MLSSEILEKQFGPTRLVVLKQNSGQRIIETIALSDKQVLELSIVSFDEKNIHIFPKIHKKIMAGTSMGKAYKQAGIRFMRKVESTTRATLPELIESEFNSKGLSTILEVDIYVGEQKVHYCHILEIYSPVVTWSE